MNQFSSEIIRDMKTICSRSFYNIENMDICSRDLQYCKKIVPSRTGTGEKTLVSHQRNNDCLFGKHLIEWR